MTDEIDLLRQYINDKDHKVFEDDGFLLERIVSADGDLPTVAAELWYIKAATVADWYDATSDGTSMSRSQVFEHCTKMAEVFSGIMGSGISGPEIESILITVTPVTEESEFV